MHGMSSTTKQSRLPFGAYIAPPPNQVGPLGNSLAKTQIIVEDSDSDGVATHSSSQDSASEDGDYFDPEGQSDYGLEEECIATLASARDKVQQLDGNLAKNNELLLMLLDVGIPLLRALVDHMREAK